MTEKKMIQNDIHSSLPLINFGHVNDEYLNVFIN